jgi:hypothetical protein
VHEICAKEVARVMANSSGLDDDGVAQLSRAISQKVAHELTKIVEHGLKGGNESTPMIIVPKG